MALGNITALCTVLFISFILLPSPATAFGAGNIASISKIEGHNWRHGDIEDLLKTVAFLHGHKWTSLMIKRVYFGNWLRDYSQALDVGTLKGVQAETIRILVWVLSFLSFGYATAEFEVTAERLGVYRPEEHIDNPRDYADNVDARRYDPRLRPPVQGEELAVDPYTGMKNYIANEAGDWATSSGYIKHSFSRSIHFGRVYTSGSNGTRGKEADLCEALRCLGQGLHCLEDFAAHTNYVELALRELGLTNVFPHTGASTELDIRGRRAFPLVTGTFGAVDFLHSVLGEATDHFTQTEVEQMDIALADAQSSSKPSSQKPHGTSKSGQNGDQLVDLLAQLPGTDGSLSQEAQRLRAAAEAQERYNVQNSRGQGQDYANPSRDAPQMVFPAPPGSVGGPPAPGIPGMSPNFDPIKTAAQIYPILEFRDRVVRAISGIIEKIPGLQKLCELIGETITIFILSLLAPFIRPIINAISKQLQEGSSAVVASSGRHQFEPWTDPYCTDPTHSLLSKDHFSNILNEVAGQVASVTLQYVAPRIIYAWSHPDVPVQQVLDDITRVFHHPAVRDPHCEIHRTMYETVRKWLQSSPNQGSKLNDILSSESVKQGRNHQAGGSAEAEGMAIWHHQHPHQQHHQGSSSHSKVRGSEWERISTRTRSVDYDQSSAEGIPPADYVRTSTPSEAQQPSPYPYYQDYPPQQVSGQYSYSDAPPPPNSYSGTTYQQQAYQGPNQIPTYEYDPGSNAGYPGYQGGTGQGYGYDPNAPLPPPPTGPYGGGDNSGAGGHAGYHHDTAGGDGGGY
ncbi:MAG: hypothetical protein M1816_004116 [Peltula sp. TS41687]|nr:MAG: hypothetical protein M1816_004116 [Peltula sp. TS41687]